MATRPQRSIISRLARYAVLPALAIATVSTAAAADYPEPGDFASGAKVWAENCNRCHNVRDPRDLRDDQWITSVFHMRIRAGLTGRETRDILSFLQASNTVIAADRQTTALATEQTTETTRSGEEIYGQTCVACHGADGKGVLSGVPNLRSADGPLGKSNEILQQNILLGYQTPGSPMAMPPKGGNAALTGADITAVLRYLREAFTSTPSK